MFDVSAIPACFVTEGLYQSPLGTLKISANTLGITAIQFISEATAMATVAAAQRPDNLCRVETLTTVMLPTLSADHQPSALIAQAQQQLEEYFQGQRRDFALPLHFSGTTFQQQVWHALAAIPYGCICSYQLIAQHIQKPKAMRAVGAANGRNPLSIVIPCHRVIGSNGSLTGYAGGLHRKLWLLQHEQRYRSKI